MYITDLMPHWLTDLAELHLFTVKTQLAQPDWMLWLTDNDIMGIQGGHSGKQKQGQTGGNWLLRPVWSPTHSLKPNSLDPARRNSPPSVQHSIFEISVNSVHRCLSQLGSAYLKGDGMNSTYPSTQGCARAGSHWLKRANYNALFLTLHSVTM